jgi:hypothetical protein
VIAWLAEEATGGSPSWLEEVIATEISVLGLPPIESMEAGGTVPPASVWDEAVGVRARVLLALGLSKLEDPGMFVVVGAGSVILLWVGSVRSDVGSVTFMEPRVLFNIDERLMVLVMELPASREEVKLASIVEAREVKLFWLGWAGAAVAFAMALSPSVAEQKSAYSRGCDAHKKIDPILLKAKWILPEIQRLNTSTRIPKVIWSFMLGGVKNKHRVGLCVVRLRWLARGWRGEQFEYLWRMSSGPVVVE